MSDVHGEDVTATKREPVLHAALRDAVAGGAVGQDQGVLYPPADLAMIVDRDNTAHVLLPRDERPVFRPTLCGGQRNDLAAIPHDVQDTLTARWDLLTDRQFRAWPPWPCQTCVGIMLRSAAESRDIEAPRHIGSYRREVDE